MQRKQLKLRFRPFRFIDQSAVPNHLTVTHEGVGRDKKYYVVIDNKQVRVFPDSTLRNKQRFRFDNSEHGEIVPIDLTVHCRKGSYYLDTVLGEIKVYPIKNKKNIGVKRVNPTASQPETKRSKEMIVGEDVMVFPHLDERVSPIPEAPGLTTVDLDIPLPAFTDHVYGNPTLANILLFSTLPTREESILSKSLEAIDMDAFMSAELPSDFTHH